LTSSSWERRRVGKGDVGFGAGGLGGGDAKWSVGELGAEAAELQVLRLQDDEVFEIGVHRMGSFRENG
jgi:hypothetical protein